MDINNKITIQWLRTEFTSVPAGVSDDTVNLPITYNKSHLCSVVGFGTRAHVIVTTYGKQPSYTRVGFYNLLTVKQPTTVYIISIGI